MASLLEEYRRRHNIKAVNPVPEGVLFFSLNNQPSMVVTTSSMTKSHTICDDCYKHPSELVIEIFLGQRVPYCVRLVTHSHISPDADLIQSVCEMTREHSYCAFISKGERDQERWLWEWFMQLQRSPDRESRDSGVSLYEIFKEVRDPGQRRIRPAARPKKKKKEEPMQQSWLEHAFATASQNPDMFRVFYDHMYAPLCINRKYILIE